jgi:predicted HAD superfamily Cof-like phosphohydrolase
MIIGIEKVREFMRTFDQECPSTPTLPPHATVKNRAYYQFSETQEMEDAQDIVEYFDYGQRCIGG